MPQALSATIRARSIACRGGEPVTRLRQSATTALVELQPASAHAADQGQEDLKAAKLGVLTAATPVQPVVADANGCAIGQIRPADKGQRHRDRPAIAALRSAASRSPSMALDAAGLERSAKATLPRSSWPSWNLVRAQDALIERDPLVAAKWFATRPPRIVEGNAARHGRRRCHRACVGSGVDEGVGPIDPPGRQRTIGGVPSMMSVFSFFPVAAEAEGSATGAEAARAHHVACALDARMGPHARRDRRRRPTDAVRRDVDPPGYEEPIRLYFEAPERRRRQRSELPHRCTRLSRGSRHRCCRRHRCVAGVRANSRARTSPRRSSTTVSRADLYISPSNRTQTVPLMGVDRRSR